MINELVEEQLQICIQKTRRNADALDASFPRFPHVAHHRGWDTSGDEEWKQLVNGYWTGGFWIGMLWLCHHLTGDDYFKDNARRWLQKLSPRAGARLIHDVGFLFYPSAALPFALTREKDLQITAKRAAYTMLRLFDKGRGCIPIQDTEEHKDVLAIDTMMNLPLLWWAGASADMAEAHDIARRHTEATARCLVRADGSTAHIARLDPQGKVVRLESWQGEAPETCWSRGHAWALAGAAHGLFFTGDAFYDKLLRTLWHFFEKNSPEDGVPHWDYSDSGGERDASAAAIIAHSLLLLSTSSQEREWAEPGLRLLQNLAEHYAHGVEHPGLLKKVCFHKPAGIDVDCSCMFADFYYMLALCLCVPDFRKQIRKLK
jgi:unsaturated chondroitin disaccharide hydrolase